MNNKDFRPEISIKIEKMDEYDTVFLGFPIWWYVAPTIINTFIESYDFSGKTVVTFCTSVGSGLGSSDNILKASCQSQVRWIPGRRLTGRESKESLIRWLMSLAYIN